MRCRQRLWTRIVTGETKKTFDVWICVVCIVSNPWSISLVSGDDLRQESSVSIVRHRRSQLRHPKSSSQISESGQHDTRTSNLKNQYIWWLSMDTLHRKGMDIKSRSKLWWDNLIFRGDNYMCAQDNFEMSRHSDDPAFMDVVWRNLSWDLTSKVYVIDNL